VSNISSLQWTLHIGQSVRHGCRDGPDTARVKTDAVDAQTLAQLLRADLLLEAYIAPGELRDLRDLLRQRFVLTQTRSALKNRAHALIARQSVQHGHSRLLGPGGRAFLAELALRPEPRAPLDVLLRLIGDFDREIDALAAEIDQRGKSDERVRWSSTTRRCRRRTRTCCGSPSPTSSGAAAAPPTRASAVRAGPAVSPPAKGVSRGGARPTADRGLPPRSGQRIA
jgi:hypothetical protein